MSNGSLLNAVFESQEQIHGVLGVAAAVLLVLAVFGAVWSSKETRWIEDGKERLGLNQLPPAVFSIASKLWLALFTLLLLGMIFVICSAIWNANATTQADGLKQRWYLITLTALTATLGAIIALPFTLIRTALNNRQTITAEQGLITDRINKAVDGLGTEKTVRYERLDAEGNPQQFNETKPNIEVRIGAIYALERIAKSEKDFHVQIMEILCAYIRENAPASEAEPWPEIEMYEDETDELLRNDWNERVEKFRKKQAKALEGVTLREDIQSALQVISRRTPEQKKLEAQAHGGDENAIFVFDSACPDPRRYFDKDTADLSAIGRYKSDLAEWNEALDDYKGYRLDLRGINLRKSDLPNINLNGARLDRTNLQGAMLFGANMQGASLVAAQMQSAVLSNARMQGSHISGANLQDTILNDSMMQGVRLYGAQMQLVSLKRALMQNAHLGGAQIQGANLVRTEMQGSSLINAQMQRASFFKTSLQCTNLRGVKMNETTSLTMVNFSGACLTEVKRTTISKLGKKIQVVFGDANALTPNSKNRPAHWPAFVLKNHMYGDLRFTDRFDEEWRKWQQLGDAYKPPTEVDEANGVFAYVEDTDD